MSLFLQIFLILVVGFVVWPSKAKPLFGIYNQPGKWFYLKALFIYTSIQLRKYQAQKGGGKNKNSKAGYGVKADVDLAEMEKAQPLGEHKLAVDAVLFSCGGKDGSYLVAAMARRKLKMNNTIFCLRIPGVGVLMHPKHPDTTFFTECDDSWDAEGLKLDLVEPMKRWTVRYEGDVVHQETGQLHKLKLEAVYTSDIPFFDFDSQMDPWTVARAFAKEPWSREYFDKIRAAHQNHYEQFGDLRGVATVDGVHHDLDLHVMRDHTHGSTRDWRLMHRYGIQHFRTRDGFRGFMGIVCQPSTFTSLELGYVFKPSTGEVLPVQELDLRLWSFGEKTGQHPTDFGFRFKAGGEWHDVQVRVIDAVEVMFGWQWEGRVIERFCEFTVDGREGWGVSEWHFAHKGGRPKALERNDPEHTKGAVKY